MQRCCQNKRLEFTSQIMNRNTMIIAEFTGWQELLFQSSITTIVHFTQCTLWTHYALRQTLVRQGLALS